MDDVAKDFHELAVQVARLDERTLSLAREIDALRGEVGGVRGEVDGVRRDLRGEIREVRSEMRWMFGGLSVLMTVGLAVLGLVLKLT